MTILQNDGQVKPDPVPTQGQGEQGKPSRETTPAELFERYSVGVKGLVQCIVENGPHGKLNYHVWQKSDEDFAAFAVKQSNKSPRAYFSMAAYDPATGLLKTYGGKTANNARSLRSFWLDIDVFNCIDKHGVPYEHGKPENTYPDHKSAMRHFVNFVRDTGLFPSDIVFTGSGGFQVHFLLDAPIAKEDWLPMACALHALCVTQGLKTDAPVTTDVARMLRAPGSYHDKTGQLVVAKRYREPPYTFEEFCKLIRYVPSETVAIGASSKAPSKYDMTVWDGIDVEHPPYSYKRAAEKCGAMRQAAENNGRDTPYPVWILALKTAELSIEGREHAHEISSGHKKYSRVGTDKKLNSLTGGPASCRAWRAAYGVGGPCGTCEYGEV
jgi:hypothetical protein